MRRFFSQIGKSAVGRVAIGAVAVSAVSSGAFATATSALPTELQPTAIVTAVTTESSYWILGGLAVLAGLTLLGALKKGMFSKGAKVVR